MPTGPVAELVRALGSQPRRYGSNPDRVKNFWVQTFGSEHPSQEIFWHFRGKEI